MLLAATAPQAAGRTYNVGQNFVRTPIEWLHRFAGLLGKSIEIDIVPPAEKGLLFERAEATDLRYPLTLDTSRIRTELGFVETLSEDEALLANHRRAESRRAASDATRALTYRCQSHSLVWLKPPPAAPDGGSMHLDEVRQTSESLGAAEDVALGVRLRARRKAIGKTMQQVADEAWLTVGFISQIERGISTPSLASLYNVAKALDASVDMFVSEPPERAPQRRHPFRPAPDLRGRRHGAVLRIPRARLSRRQAQCLPVARAARPSLGNDEP